MKQNRSKIEIQARSALKECLARASISIVSMEKKTDLAANNGFLLAKLATQAGKLEFVVEVRPNGQPRIIREALGVLLMLKRNHPMAYGVVAAPYISAKSAAILSTEDVGFVDFAGNCRLNFGGLFIERSGQSPPPSARREQRSLFTPKAARVLRVLLENPKKKWRLSELAKEADVSLGQTFNVKELLLNCEFAAMEDDVIVLNAPEMLLSEWKEVYVARKNWSEYFTLKNPAEFETELTKLCDKKGIPYALTGFSAAFRYAPMMRSNRAMAYVSGDPNAIAHDLGLKAVTSGANVALAFPSDESVYYGSQEIDGIKIISPLQAYLDLVGFRGRGNEAAQTILERKIRPAW